MQAEQWSDWLRRSPTGGELLTQWSEGDRLSPDELVPLLSRAVPRDCAAAGFGCTRRIDRPCRAPEICAQEPAGNGRRDGPVAGACQGFYGSYGDRTAIWVTFSPADRHRAVSWVDSSQPARLWIDGRSVGADFSLDAPGSWVDGRFYTVDMEGPDDHPEQEYTVGRLVTTIVSVLVYDVELGATRVLVPRPHERWTQPRLVRTGEALHIYPNGSTETPDRTITLP